ncbi:SDR family NAD(P)-dependent oxidoreductase [Tateyamaria omphalii]|uniref:3-hydroxyacyl-CoA dehydrogenase n=1 Tax=Tateyamaria omphalii TaxID=299262 RepID=A0A1P8MX53_9RHOB|nr:SDR family oxidoreductase [Tateyamaria omphalii]APX12654.1 3-hydroxyacyl-CoA dehydrogenase [Tateyamaria omphalii]
MRQVLITGGGTGIGRAIAHAFADAGDAVTITGRRPDVLKEAAKSRAITCRTADVTDEAAVAALFGTPFDVVIANAGGGASGKLVKTSLADWNSTLAVNLTGTFLTFRAALPHMTTGGRLIAIASTAALKGNASVPAYTAAKHGVLGLVRAVAHDVATSGITCNAICPGFTDTPLADDAITGLMRRFDVDRDKATAMVTSGNPQNRLIAPDEVAATALFLASPEAAAINGHALSLSGGEI